MDLGFLHLAQRKRKIFLVLRLDKKEIDFLLFKQEGSEICVLSYGSEDMSHFNARQVLEKIFARLPKEGRIHELVATFGANVFRAQMIRQLLPSTSPPHRIDTAEALSIERQARERAELAFEQSLFQESGILPSEFSLRRLKILERRIDGYSVPRLESFKGGEIDFLMLGMFLLEPPFRALEHFAKAHQIANMRVMHIAEALEAFAGKSGPEGVYLVLEDEHTQIAIQNQGHFLFLGTIAMGEEDFSEFFADALGMRESFVQGLQKQYFEGTLSLEARERMQTYLLPEIQKFGTVLKKKLLGAKIGLPDSFWMFGRVRMLRDLKSLFAKDTLQDLPFAQNPRMNFLLPRDVWKAKDFPGAHDPRSTTLCLLGVTALHSQ